MSSPKCQVWLYWIDVFIILITNQILVSNPIRSKISPSESPIRHLIHRIIINDFYILRYGSKPISAVKLSQLLEVVNLSKSNKCHTTYLMKLKVFPLFLKVDIWLNQLLSKSLTIISISSLDNY